MIDKLRIFLLSVSTVMALTALSGAAAAQVAAGTSRGDSPAAAQLDASDAAYLRALTADTWRCIAYFVEPSTGLPYDTSQRPEFTSVSNIGLYAAACGVAAELKLVDRDEATARVRRVLDAHERFKKWRGFSQSWNSVRTLEPSPEDTMVSILDSANMVAGLVVAGQALPDVREQVQRALDGMDWSAVYDAEKKQLFGGYDLARGRLDPGWHIGLYASDGRMAAFWAIVSGAAPPESWEALGRETEEHYGLTIYRPAWAGGGLFMQALDGLFLDERATPIGKSTANFAYAQMIYAEQFDLPLWGWSACSAPGGEYLGWGSLDVSVVTPHAVGLAAMYYPRRATQCLKQLEKFGARQAYEEGGKEYKFGFSDSVNFQTRAVQRNFLPPLDQGMLFLSLANLLEDGVVQRLFQSHATVQRGRRIIAEYAAPVDRKWLAELQRRDGEPLPSVTSGASEGPSMVLVDDFESGDIARNRLGGRNHTWTRDAADADVSIKLSRVETERDGRTTGCMQINYDVEASNPAFGGVTLDLSGANASGCDALEMWVRGQPDSIKVELHGKGGIGVTYLQDVPQDRWQRVRIPFLRFGGLITDWSELSQMILVFEDSRSRPKTGTLLVDDVRLVEAPGAGDRPGHRRNAPN